MALQQDEADPKVPLPKFPRRRIIDARLALRLKAHGVTKFATVNVKDFTEFGFESVFNPLS